MHRSSFAENVEFTLPPIRGRNLYIGLIHAGALACTWLLSTSLYLNGLLSCLIVLSLGWQLSRPNPAQLLSASYRNRRWQWQLANDGKPPVVITPADNIYISPWLVVFCFQSPEGKGKLLVPKSRLPASLHRRLRVILNLGIVD